MGNNAPGAESLDGAEKNKCRKYFLQYNASTRKRFRFEHGGVELVSCPGHHLTSVRPSPLGILALVQRKRGFLVA